MNYLGDRDIGGTFIKYAVITENCSHPGKDKTPTNRILWKYLSSSDRNHDRIKGQYGDRGNCL